MQATAILEKDLDQSDVEFHSTSQSFQSATLSNYKIGNHPGDRLASIDEEDEVFQDSESIKSLNDQEEEQVDTKVKSFGFKQEHHQECDITELKPSLYKKRNSPIARELNLERLDSLQKWKNVGKLNLSDQRNSISLTLSSHSNLKDKALLKYQALASHQGIKQETDCKNSNEAKLQLASISEEMEQPPFQSETTLIESNNDLLNSSSLNLTTQSSLNNTWSREDIFSSFKARIAKFLEKPIEKLYGKAAVTTTTAVSQTSLNEKNNSQSNNMTISTNKNQVYTSFQDPSILQEEKSKKPTSSSFASHRNKKPTTESRMAALAAEKESGALSYPSEHRKSSSLLSKISHKLHQLKPFHHYNDVTPMISRTSTKSQKLKLKNSKKSSSLRKNTANSQSYVKNPEVKKKSSSHASADGDEDHLNIGYMTEAEYLRALKSRKLFESRYKILREVGSGGHSTVYLAERVQDHSIVVCKFIKKSSVWRWYKDPLDGSKIPFEIHCLRKFKNETKLKIIQYYDHYGLGNGRFVIVMEYLGEEWCDLYDYVEKYGPVKENHAREIFAQVVNTINEMHSLGYLHNDMKDENIMINMKTREIKLIDFGSCTPLVPGKKAKLFYGTKKFAAPEALQNDEYDPSAQEVWALGTLLYVLLFKMDPFKTDEEIIATNIAQKIQRLRISGYNSYTPINISDESVDAMLAMLTKDPLDRISIHEIPSLEFFHL